MAQLKINTTIDGQTAWHAGNDGTGSGLDADLLDGLEATAFATSGHTHTSAGITDFAEAVSDQIGTMVTGNTETGITVTYQDADNTLDFTIAYGTPVTLNPDAANSAGSGNTAARANHVHNVPAASAVSISDATSNAEGVSTSFARADHTHAVTGFATSSHNHDAAYVNISGDTMTGALSIHGASGSLLRVKDTGDSFDTFAVTAEGVLQFGDGSQALGNLTLTTIPNSSMDLEIGSADFNVYTSGDVNFFNAASITLNANTEIDGNLTIDNGYIYSTRPTSGDVLYAGVDGDSSSRFYIASTGYMEWGSGSAARDTWLFRDSAGVLSTSGLKVSNSLTLGGDPVIVNAATGSNAIAIGDTSDASALNTIAIGRSSLASVQYATSIGDDAHATADSALAAGAWAAAGGSYSVALGNNAQSGGSSSIAIRGLSGGSSAIAIGNSSDAPGNWSIAIGYHPDADGDNSIAIGREAIIDATHDNSVAIGYNATTTAANQGVLGVADGGSGPYNWSIPGNLTLGGDLTLAADPTSNLHAATKQYVDVNDVHRSDTAPASPAVGKLWLDTDDGTGNFQDGYRLLTTLYYTSSGTFEKGSYPGMKAIRVRVLGGGGAGGGGAATTASQGTAGSGGAGAGYAEKFILESALATSETVTVGAGGAGVSGTHGNPGGDSSFGTHCTGPGGGNGSTGTSSSVAGVPGPDGSTGTGGDLNIQGGKGGNRFTNVATFGTGGRGGDTILGTGGPTTFYSGGGSPAGQDGSGYGAGGSGASASPNSAAAPGGDGAPGIVIVEVYV